MGMQHMERIHPFSMRLDPRLKKALEELALEENRSLTNYVETVLTSHVRKLKPDSIVPEPKRSGRK